MDKQKEKLKQMLTAEREKVAGYEQIAKAHSAYISILLKKLGATQDNPLPIMALEVKEAMQKYEARAIPIDGLSLAAGFGLYCEEIE